MASESSDYDDGGMRAERGRVDEVERAVAAVAKEVRALRGEIRNLPSHIGALRGEVAALVGAARRDVDVVRRKQDELEGDSVAVVECLRQELMRQGERVAAAEARLDTVTEDNHPGKHLRVEQETRATMHSALAQRLDALERRAGEDLRAQRDTLAAVEADLKEITDGRSVKQMRLDEEKRFFVVWDLKRQVEGVVRDHKEEARQRVAQMGQLREECLAAQAAAAAAAAADPPVDELLGKLLSHDLVEELKDELRGDLRLYHADTAPDVHAASPALSTLSLPPGDRLDTVEREVIDLRMATRALRRDITNTLRKMFDLEKSSAFAVTALEESTAKAHGSPSTFPEEAVGELQARLERALTARFQDVMAAITPLFESVRVQVRRQLTEQKEQLELYVDERLLAAPSVAGR